MRTFLSLVLAAALIGPAYAYDECGGPPEAPALPDAVTATTDDMHAAQQGHQDYALDIEGYLVCLQLAESDVGAEAARGQRTAASAESLQTRFRDQGADARGRQTGWRDDYDRWIRAWAHAHGQLVPAEPQ